MYMEDQTHCMKDANHSHEINFVPICQWLVPIWMKLIYNNCKTKGNNAFTAWSTFLIYTWYLCFGIHSDGTFVDQKTIEPPVKLFLNQEMARHVPFWN